MSYIGRNIDSINNISTLDNLSFNGSDATFNLTQNSVAFVPVSADALQIQIDGVIQSGNYTVSGSTVTFDFTPSGSSVCNGIRHYGVGLLTTVSDSSITTAKLGADSVNGSKIADDSISDEHLDNTAITGQTAITSLADTDKFLVSDASDSGNLKYVEKQYLPSGALSLTSATTVSAATSVTIQNCFSSSFQNYMLVVQNLRSNSDCNIRLRFAVSGSNDSANQYRYAGMGRDKDGADRSYNGSSTSMVIGNSLDGNDGASDLFGIYYICDPMESSINRKRVTGHYNNSHTSGNSVDTTYNFAGTFEKASTSFDGLTIFTDSGSLRAGDADDGHGLIKVYGIADS